MRGNELVRTLNIESSLILMFIQTCANIKRRIIELYSSPHFRSIDLEVLKSKQKHNKSVPNDSNVIFQVF